MIDTILFDVDGTIIDTEAIVVKSFQEIINEELQLTKEAKDLDFILGIPGRDALKTILDSESEIEKILALWSERLNQYADEAQVFNGIKNLLTLLKSDGYKLGVVTSKLADDLTVEFERFDLTHYFEVMITPEDTNRHKPHAEPILKALEVLKSQPEKAIYIGDSVYDFRSATASC